nr:uncharacterized mitochondrial protein AtMg00810-like [Tanacetum cinerariifolium]
MKTYKNVSQDIRDQLNAEAEVVQIILTGIDNDIYSTVDACPNACEMWKAIERLKQGESINVQDLETNLYWEFRKFTSQSGESLESYYSRFYKMMNELIRNQCDVTNHQVNVQFLLQLQPEWQRSQQAATRNRGKVIVNSPQPIYDQEPSLVAEDDEMSKDKEIDKRMALISLSFKKIYKPTKNNLQTSSNTNRANQGNYPRINRSTGYENQRIGNVVGARETIEQVDSRDDIDDESKDQELEAHYMYMAQLQEVSPDAANSRPIFDSELVQKVSTNDHYNVFAIESEHPEQSKFVHHTYSIEQDEHNMIIDSLDISYDREQIDQNDDDNDLANEREIEDFKNKNKSLESSNNRFKEANNKLSETNKLLYNDFKKSQAELQRRNDVQYASKKLSAHQDTISILSQQKQAQIKLYKTHKDKELDKVIALENKVKVLDNIVYKIGQSVQTMNMLNNKCRTEFLKKAQRANPRLYDIGCYNDNLTLMLAPESDEVIRLEKESRSKLSNLIRSFDYDKLNNLYDLFVPQHEKSSEQRYFSERSRLSHTPVNNGNSKESFNKQTTLLEKRMDESIPEYYYADHMNAILGVYTELDKDLKAQLQDKGIVISELKKVIEKLKGKSVDTKFGKSSVIRQPNAFKTQRPSILGKPTIFSDSLERKDFSKSKTKMPIVVPVSTREPNCTVKQYAAKPLKKTVASETTNQKSRNITRKLYERVSKACSWWYPMFTPSGYKWKPKSEKENVNPNVSMPLGSVSRFANILEPMTSRHSTVSNIPLSSNSFAAHKDCPIHYLYSITLQDTNSPNPICLMAKVKSSQAWLWHRRLSHLNFDTINLLSKNDIVVGLPKLKFVKDHLCSSSTEFLNKTLHAYFASEGILHQTSVVRTPEQNCVVERRNRTLVEAARTMLSVVKVPLFFWVEAIATTCFTQNHSLVIPRYEKTPYHIINDRKPSVKFFHIFGTLCYIVRDGENLDKMKEKGDACIFVGYSTQSRAYRVFNKRTRVIVEMIHVNFDELPQMASDHVSSDPGPQCQSTALEHDSLCPSPQCCVKVFAVTTVDAPNKRQQQHTTPLSNQTTPDPTCQAPTQAPSVTSPENMNQAEMVKEYAQVKNDAFINIFYTPEGIDFEESFALVARLEAVSVGTPMATKHLDADLSGTSIDQTNYRSMVRALMYLTASRPDFMNATCYCARYQAKPTETVKRIFRYLKDTIHMRLWYPKDTGFELTAFSDSDHAGCLDSSKSTSGGIQFLGGDKLVRWSSKKQDCTSMSFAKVEYVSLSA